MKKICIGGGASVVRLTYPISGVSNSNKRLNDDTV